MSRIMKVKRNKQKIKWALLLLLIAIIIVIGSSFALFSDRMSAVLTGKAGILNIEMKDRTRIQYYITEGIEKGISYNSNIDNLNPGDIIDTGYTVINEGNKSAYIRTSIDFTISGKNIPEDILEKIYIFPYNQEEEQQRESIRSGEQKEAIELEFQGETIEEGIKTKSYKYVIDQEDIKVLNGKARLIGTEIEQDGINDEYIVRYLLYLSPEAKNEYQGLNISLTIIVDAMQYRNNNEPDWTKVASITMSNVLEASAKYSTKDPTQEGVTVTITASKTILPIAGWEQDSENDTIYTKIYTSNTNEIIIVSDSSGNEYEINIQIFNIDKTPPVITINGGSTVTIGVSNEPYIDLGAVVTDNLSTGLTATSTGYVNTSVEGTYSIIYSAIDEAGNEATARRTVYITSNVNLKSYAEEMDAIEELILNINSSGASRIGTELNMQNMVTIRGINYYDRWYKLSAADILSINPSLDVTHAPYIIRYEYTSGAVLSIEGEIIGGTPIHTFNYAGDPETYSLYSNGLLTAVTQNSTKSDSAWGEAVVGTGAKQTPPTVAPGGAVYDNDGGLILGGKVGFLAIDQERPVGQRYAINVTIKGSIYQDAETYGATIIAISDATSKYLAWIRIRNGYLQVITFSTNNQSNLTGNTSGTGFMSKAIPVEYNNSYMNIQITAERAGMARVYLNGELFSEFQSGAEVLSYGNMTIGDLRPARNLNYVGSVYNFALYSETLDQDAITQNWNYFKNEFSIE